MSQSIDLIIYQRDANLQFQGQPKQLTAFKAQLQNIQQLGINYPPNNNNQGDNHMPPPTIDQNCLQKTIQKDNYAGTQSSLRAEFKTCNTCPRIVLQCRIIQSEKQQKSVSFKTELHKSHKSHGLTSNETKNIAKNYGKAIIAYIKSNKRDFKIICKNTSTPMQRITEELSELKKALTTVAGFRKIWKDYKYCQCMRIVSNSFLRKCAFAYIFNSKISNIQTHIKYRGKFLQGLKNPQTFDHIKDN